MLETFFPTLSRVRFVVQLGMLFLTVYGSVVVGTYAADKITGALPALSCAYDQANGAYCVLVPTQHQVHHRIGMAMVQAQQLTTQMVLPLLMVFITFFALFFVIGKAFCGWVCPLGTLQEWVGKIGRRFGFGVRRFEKGDLGEVKRIRPVKWVVLLGFVFLLPLLTGLGVTPHSLGNPYCDICPSRIATTLLTGNTEELALRMNDAAYDIDIPFSGRVRGEVVQAHLATTGQRVVGRECAQPLEGGQRRGVQTGITDSDGGPYADRFETILSGMGINRVDYIVLSHAHFDHYGGLSAAIKRLPMDCAPRFFDPGFDAATVERAGTLMAKNEYGQYLLRIVDEKVF